MEKLLFINACVREHSRTLTLAQWVLDWCGGEISQLNLEHEALKPLDRTMLKKREELVAQNHFSDSMFGYAKQFADADVIVIAAPYWDLTFPALLKLYLEQIAVCGLTFRYDNGVPKSLCRAKRLIYVTTAGGLLDEHFGFGYIKALAQQFYGIGEALLFKAENLDIEGNDVGEILQTAKRDIDTVMQGLCQAPASDA